MTIGTSTKKQEMTLKAVLKELKAIKNQLENLLISIPEESLQEYKNSSQIKKDYSKALKVFP